MTSFYLQTLTISLTPLSNTIESILPQNPIKRAHCKIITQIKASKLSIKLILKADWKLLKETYLEKLSRMYKGKKKVLLSMSRI